MHLCFLSSSSLFKVSVIGLSVYVVVCHWGDSWTERVGVLLKIL